MDQSLAAMAQDPEGLAPRRAPVAQARAPAPVRAPGPTDHQADRSSQAHSLASVVGCDRRYGCQATMSADSGLGRVP